jgi:hypothetical protein
MRVQGETVGHAGDEVGDAARPRGLVGLLETLSPFVRQILRMRQEMAEQVAHHAFGRAHHAHHPRVAIHARKQEVLDGAVSSRHLGREARQRLARLAHRIGRGRRVQGEAPGAFRDHILDHAVDQASDHLVHQTRLVDAGEAAAALVDDLPHQRDGGEILEVEQLGAQPVVDIVGIVGDVVGDGRDLRLEAGMAPELQVLQLRIIEDRRRHRAVAAGRATLAVDQRPVVLDDAFQGLPGEIEPIEGRIPALDRGHDPQRLSVVVEAAEAGEAGIQGPLARMAERRVAEVVGERQGLGKILVQAQRAGERAGDLGDFQGMGEARPVVVALVEHEYLGLVLEPAKRRRVDDPVAIAPEIAAGAARRLGVEPAAARPGIGRIGGMFGIHPGVPELTLAGRVPNYR